MEKRDLEAAEGILSQYWSGELKGRFLQRLTDFVNQTPEAVANGYRCFVAEENGELVGLAAMRQAPEHMRAYAQHTETAEFYVLAVKYAGRGIGSALREKRIEEARKLGYKEIVLYGAESHKEFWDFHDKSEFKRAGPAVAPNGEAGVIWRMEL